MNKLLYSLGTILLVIAAWIGFASNEENIPSIDSQEQVNEPESIEVHSDQENTELIEGIDTVITSIEELQNIVEASPSDVNQINEKGKVLETNWDVIEKQVEELDKEAYVNIEKSLYPLIAEAKKDNPNVENLKSLASDTTEKLTDFKNEISSS
ncbi:hypothetical protein [Salinibacillus xinjiangensis]|uniref:DUF4363 family protein n=1 Tax=Salinibacillus xinjiangensis TaxID=1229268 RepID=A0A6G1X6A9_9BACI|nr:hypothetical protein [Salinibacillus xinjiangensis]MRG86504.1 hypothetical protein [Salinibacillus xinjiangensis]